MDDTLETQYIVEMNKNLGEINAKLSTLCNTLAQHEARISTLERHPSNQPVRDNINKWLMIALIGCVSVIVTLTGSASILKFMIGV